MFFFSQASRKSKKKSRSRKNDEKLEKESKNRDTIDLWLGNDTTSHGKGESSGPETAVNETDAKKHSKTKRVKSKKKDRSAGDDKLKRRRKHKESGDGKHIKISGYEEATGISTPSAEILPNLNDSHDGYEKMHNSQPVYKKLIRNERMEILYDLMPMDTQMLNEAYKMIVSVELKNLGGQLLRDLSLDVPDTTALKVVRNVSQNRISC